MQTERVPGRSEHRDRILEAARAAFAARGFDAVTMADIAQHAGVARATVFNYFPSKHALVQAITIDVFSYYWAMIDQALQDETTPTSMLLRGLMSHMGAGIEHYHAFYRSVHHDKVVLHEGNLRLHTRLQCVGIVAGHLQNRIHPGVMAGVAESLVVEGFDLPREVLGHVSGSLRTARRRPRWPR